MNTVKYNANQENMNSSDNLQIVRSHFFTDRLLFFYIQSNMNTYLFISIQICCQLIPTKGLFGYIQLFVIFCQLFDEQ